MARFYKPVLVTVIYITLIFSASATINKQGPGQATIRGHFIDTSLSNNADNTASIRIFVTAYPFGLASISRTHPMEYQFSCKQNDSFKITIATSKLYQYIHFQVKFPGAPHSRFIDGIDNLYIIEPGDNINCNFYSDHSIFSGQGSAKYNAFNFVYRSIFLNMDFEKANKLSNDGILTKYFAYTDSIDDLSYINARNGLLKFKDSVSSDVYRILQANAFPLKFLGSCMYTIHENAIFGAPVEQIKFAFDCYRARRETEKTSSEEKSELLLSKSSLYLAFLLKKSYADVQMGAYQNSDSISITSFKPFYEDIKNNYKGALRDYLLLEAFLSFMDFRPDAYAFLNDAIMTVNTEAAKTLLLEIKRTSSKAEPFYHFKLKDSLGNMVRLIDFKNRLLVLDFWYTGCENCLILRKALTPIFEKYKGNQDVVFLSVSIDNNINEWKRSLRSGIYTDGSEINLYTNGNGANDPLIKYYGIEGFPKQYVVLNGLMYDPNPPRASYDSQGGGLPSLSGATAKFDEVIQKGLYDLKNGIK